MENSRFIGNGNFEIVRITKEYQEEAVKLFMEHFLHNENFSIATNLPANPEAVKEIQTLFIEVLKDGISFAAKHIETGSLVALCGNKLMDPSSNSGLEEIFNTLKTPEMIFIGSLIDQLEKSFNIYKEFDTNSCVEIVFLSTKSGFERMGLAKSLTNYTINFLRDSRDGILPDDDIPKHVQGKQPKAVCSVFTSTFTQLLGERLGFNTVGRIQFVDVKYNGYAFSEKLAPIHSCAAFAVKKL